MRREGGREGGLMVSSVFAGSMGNWSSMEDLEPPLVMEM